MKLLKQADRAMELLDVDEAKFSDDLAAQQADFASRLNTLASVCACDTLKACPDLLPSSLLLAVPLPPRPLHSAACKTRNSCDRMRLFISTSNSCILLYAEVQLWSNWHRINIYIML